jgi:hypothetical protein
MSELGDPPDYPRLAAEVLGIRNAPDGLARRLVAQALVFEERRDTWRRAGGRLAADAPSSPGVYVLCSDDNAVLYVGKTINLRRRLRAHFAARRWRALQAGLARASRAEWQTVGSELEALLREASLIAALRPPVNLQVGAPRLATRAIPAALVRDVIVVVPSVETDSAELVAARADGAWLMQRTRRDGADLAVHTARLMRFFHSPLRSAGAGLRTRPGLRDAGAGRKTRLSCEPDVSPPLAPIVFSWLAGRGAGASRLDPHDAASARELRGRLQALLGDAELFRQRIVVVHSEVRTPRRVRP